MKKSNLVKKIGQGLGILTLGMFIGSGICYAKETNPEGYAIPNISNATFMGTRYDDLTDKIDGPETRIDIYEMDKKDIYKVSINGNVFLYGISDDGTKDLYAIADLNGDGIFETKYDVDELKFTETRQDGKVPDFPAKKDLPPKWVLE